MNREPLDAALDEAARPLRGMSGLARLIAGTAIGCVVLALAAWLFRVGVLRAPVWVIVTWALLVTAAVVGFVAARRAIGALGPWQVARRLEDAGAWRRGALTTVLDGTAIGTSAALHDDAAQRSARDVVHRGSDALAPHVARQIRSARRALLMAAGAVLVFAAARPLSGAPAKLWRPLDAWHALTGVVRLVARSPSVDRGARATLELMAAGHDRAMLHTRAPGERWRVTPVQLDAAGRAVVTTAPLASDIVARLEAGGRRSTEVRITMRLPAFLGAFTATANYPAYLGLEPEAMSITGDTLILPAGTRLAIAGRATTELSSVRLDGPDGTTPLVVAGGAFRGDLVPRATATWHLVAVTATGAALDGDAPSLPIRILVDSAPHVEIPIPGVDTVAPPTMTLGIVVSVRDDYGLSTAALESRRGGRGAITRIPLALPTGHGDRALVATTLDLTALGFRAGDTLYYAAVATDNAPTRHVGRSREFMVRIPTADEQRQARSDATGETAAALDSLAAQARRAQRQTEDLARERQRAASKPGGGSESEPMSLDAARKADAAAAAQEKVLDQAEHVRKSVDELQRAAEREGLADSALAAQLGEIRKLLDQAISPELRQKLAELRSATKALDADRTRTALDDLARRQTELRDAIEQAKELFKRAALETDLANLAQEAKQLADQQRSMTDKLARPDSASQAAAAQDALATRADSLAAALDRAAGKAPAQQSKAGLKQASQQAKNASRKMRDAAQAARDGDEDEAKAAGDDAEQELEPLDDKIREEREQMQREMRDEVMRALDRALSETSRLAERQVAVADAFRRGALVSQSRSEQGLLEEGTAKVLLQVMTVAGKNALVSPQATAALSAARVAMRSAIEAVSTGSPNLRDAGDQAGDAVDALAVAAFQLLRSKERVGGAQSGSGLQEAMEEMQQMAGKQGQMSQQAQGMLQQGQGGMQQLMQMAMQQRAVAQQLERMRAGGQIPGAGELAREAKELSRTIEAGRLSTETVARQERLFRRMLDAGRTLQGEERDESKERQSEAPKDGTLRLPPSLDPALRDDVVRLPSWDSLQRLSTEDRRRVLDYFRRLAEGVSR